ncbi:MAG: hypothetical protein AB9836_04465 [Aminipila sp.]
MDTKGKICEHDYSFDLSLRTMTYPPKVKGVCKKCGEQIEIPLSEYAEKYSNKK